MKLTLLLFRKIILLHIAIDKSKIVRKEMATIRFLNGKTVVSNWMEFETESLSKLKNSLVLMIITGDGIISKVYDKQDPINKKVMKDAEFIWNIETTDNQVQKMSFLRRNYLSEFLKIAERQQLILVDTWIYNAIIENDIQIRLEKLYKDQFRSTTIFQSPGFRNKLANAFFQKIFLPVLLVFFVLLLGNYFFNSYYTKQYQQKQSVIQLDERKKQRKSLEEQKKNQLLAGYNQIPNQSFALIADRIASYIPMNLYLTSMNVFPLGKNSKIRGKKILPIDYHIIQLKGTVETPGSVTLLSQLLSSDSLFEKVKVIQLARKKNMNIFEFEIEITL